jgi:ATP-dependent helicase HrpA
LPAIDWEGTFHACPVPTPDQKPAFRFRIDFPPDLPITPGPRKSSRHAAHQVVILAGETGSGKTTQIPKMCLAAGRGTPGRIACTQPRRVAALSVSRRVAEELGVEWGREVGCKIRFNDQTTSRHTVIKFLTDGMLLAEVQGDPLLRDYDTDHHRRGARTLAQHRLPARPPAHAAFKRPELKIIITSATIDTEAFSAGVRRRAGHPGVEGRTFPVEVIYAPLDGLGATMPRATNEDQAAAARLGPGGGAALHRRRGGGRRTHRAREPSGDILVFLPSERDIRELRDLLEAPAAAAAARSCPFSAGSPTPSSSASSLRPSGARSCWRPISPRRRSPFPASASSSIRASRG